MMTNSSAISPATTNQRIQHLDIIRGIALLGILLMNIQSFAMPFAAYSNPINWGGFDGINQWIWSINYLFADMKFMTIFSMLFGAGICLFAHNAEKKSGSALGLHFQRNFYLLLFGMLHGYFIWYGDILVSYALCGFLLYWFRNLSSRWLIILGIFSMSLSSALLWMVQLLLDTGAMPQESLTQMQNQWAPSAEVMQKEINAFVGSYAQQFEQRFLMTLNMQTEVFLSFSLWRVSGSMMIGMALYKSGVLSGQKSTGFYIKMALIGIVCGLALTGWGLSNSLAENFALETAMIFGVQTNYWGSILSALGYIGVINLIINAQLFAGLQQRLAAVGQMAFSNYIAHSLICTGLFYGLGFFGTFERYEQLLLVLAIWTLQLWYSNLWLSNYRFGPLEWVWRSMTYRKLQAMK